MRIAINGFGRIGRIVFRVALSRGIDVVAINDVHGVEDAVYLLKYDSVYGKFDRQVEHKGNEIIIGGKKIKVLKEREPLKLPWKQLKVDVVVEATGAFRNPKDAAMHNRAGAKYVLITAPTQENKPDITIVPGVNHQNLTKNHRIISVASCTTNCLAPLVKVLDDSFGIERAFMTTVHSYTSSQGLVDSSARKPARGRAAAFNIVTTTTGASEAVCEVLPKLKGKLDGMAIRVPVICGSITDLTAVVKRNTTVHSVNKIFKDASRKEMKGIIEYNEEPLVSSDIIGNPHSAVFNAGDTKVNQNLVKVLAWYDNELGYSSRVVDVIKMLKKWC